MDKVLPAFVVIVLDPMRSEAYDFFFGEYLVSCQSIMKSDNDFRLKVLLL